MKSTKAIQFALIIAATAILAIVYFIGSSNSTALSDDREAIKKDVGNKEEAEFSGFDFQRYMAEAKKGLPDSVREELARLKPNEDSAYWLKVARIWEGTRYPAIAGHYYEQVAQRYDSSKWWYAAADNFSDAQKMARDSMAFAFFVDHSITGFERVINIDPENLEAKAELAVSYVEGRNDVMKGVGLLKEVEQVEPDNQKALFYLGVLSIRSGQYEKAEDRFQRLISLNPAQAFNYYYLAQVYMRTGKKEKAIDALESYKGLVQDEALKRNADQMIENLKDT